MELILSTIAAGGLVGAADQYLCLIIIGLMSRLGVITLTPQMQFMGSWWFMSIAALFWLLTVVPAYLSALDPGITKAINTIANFLSGFLVPASAALISLASIGIITQLHPDLKALLETLQVLGSGGNIGKTGWLIAGGGAVTAASLTGMRFLAKPATTVAAGNLAAPVHATYENTASIILMSLAYWLSKANPWLLVGLLALVVVGTLVILGFALYQLWLLKRGIGKVMYLTQTHPRAGLAIIAEFFVWGSGWLMWNVWARGAIMIVALAAWVLLFLSLEGIVGAAFLFAPPLIPIMMTVGAVGMIMVFIAIGLSSARALMQALDERLPTAYAGMTTSQ